MTPVDVDFGDEHEIVGDGSYCRSIGAATSGGARLLLLHGLASHAGWWRNVSIHLAREHPVTVLEFSGHGRSGRRTAYSGERWANEVVGVLDARGHGPPWIIVGHSMGGAIATKVAWHPAVAGVILIDTRLSVVQGLPQFRYPERHWPFATLQQVRDNFRVWPPEHIAKEDLTRLALGAVTPVRDRFVWSFDPAVFSAPRRNVALADVLGLEKPWGLLRGSASPILSAADYESARASGRARLSGEIEGAEHHVVVTHPEMTTAFIRTFVGAVVAQPNYPSGMERRA